MRRRAAPLAAGSCAFDATAISGDPTMKTRLALVAALVLATGSSAFALEGYDGDNNPIPGGGARMRSTGPAVYAQDRAFYVAPRYGRRFGSHARRRFDR
jgi:hypothetical protein